MCDFNQRIWFTTMNANRVSDKVKSKLLPAFQQIPVRTDRQAYGRVGMLSDVEREAIADAEGFTIDEQRGAALGCMLLRGGSLPPSYL